MQDVWCQSLHKNRCNMHSCRKCINVIPAAAAVVAESIQCFQTKRVSEMAEQSREEELSHLLLLLWMATIAWEQKVKRKNVIIVLLPLFLSRSLPVSLRLFISLFLCRSALSFHLCFSNKPFLKMLQHSSNCFSLVDNRLHFLSSLISLIQIFMLCV